MDNHVPMPSTRVRKPRFFYGYIIVLAAFLTMIVALGALLSFGVFFKPVLAEFGWTREVTSGAYSLCVLLWGLLGIVVGRLNDRLGPRVIVTTFGALLGLGYLLLSRVSAVWQLYLFYGVMVGIGMTACYVPLISTVARWFVKRRGLMTGIVVSGAGIGAIIMPPAVSRLVSAYGWRNSYIIIGIMVWVMLVVAAQFLRRDPSQVSQLPDGETEVKQKSLVWEAREVSLPEAIHSRQFWMLCAISLGFGFSIDPIIVHIVPHATDLGISAIAGASILSVIGGLSIAGRISMGSVGDRIGNKLALIISLISLSAALFWLLFAQKLWAFYLFAVLFGFGYGGAMAIWSPIVAYLFGLGSHGVVLGIVFFVSTIGGAVGPLIAGRVFDATGSYQLAFLGFAMFSVTGLILAWLLRPPYKENAGGNGKLKT